MAEDAPDHHDLAVLRQEINTRFSSMERWVERCTTAIEHLTDQRERITVLEQRCNGLELAMNKAERRLDISADRETTSMMSITKLDMFKSGSLAIIMLVLGAMGAGFFHHLFNPS